MAKIDKNPSTMLYPVPAVMVSCKSQNSNPNIITIAWVGTICSTPPMVGISITPARYSYNLIKDSGEFVVNLPTATQAKEVDYCGVYSGRDYDKFSECGFSILPGKKVSAPGIAQCPVNLECKVNKILNLGSHDLFIGEILNIQVDEDIQQDGKLSVEKAQPLAFLGGDYWSLGNMVAKRGVSLKRK